MKLKQLSWSDFEEFRPCYSPVEKYGEFSGTILDILNDERIPDEDKIWAGTRNSILDDRTLRLFMCGCVREVWYLLTDDRSRAAVEVAERYANGEASEEELSAASVEASGASDAAWYASSAASMAASMAASSAVAWYAASAASSVAANVSSAASWYAARAVASAVASAVARNEARNAAWGTAWSKQVEILKKIITENYEL